MTFCLTMISRLNGNGQVTAVYSNLSFDLLTAPASPVLTVSPTVVNFDGLANSGPPSQQTIVVQNSGSGSLTFTASVVSGSPWVSISPSSGTVTPGSPVNLTVTANAQGLKAGSYRDIIQLFSGTSAAAVPVTFFATNAGPILWARPVGVTFNMVQGAGSSATQTLVISNQGDGTSMVNWTAAAATGPGIPNGNFLAFGSQNGQVQAGNVLNVPLSLNSNASKLAAGVYYELIEVSAPGAQNSPQYATAVLNVAPASASVQPAITPGGLLFTGVAGQSIASQQVTVNWSSAQTQVVQSVASTPNGQSWLQVTPAGALVMSNNPAGDDGYG